MLWPLESHEGLSMPARFGVLRRFALPSASGEEVTRHPWKVAVRQPCIVSALRAASGPWPPWCQAESLI